MDLAGSVAGQAETQKAGILTDAAPSMHSRGRTRTCDPVINSHTEFAPVVGIAALSCTPHHRNAPENAPDRSQMAGYLAGQHFDRFGNQGLYAAADRTRKIVKFGVTNNYPRRMTSLCASNPFVEPLGFIPHAAVAFFFQLEGRMLEYHVHLALCRESVGHEWFHDCLPVQWLVSNVQAFDLMFGDGTDLGVDPISGVDRFEGCVEIADAIKEFVGLLPPGTCPPPAIPSPRQRNGNRREGGR